MPNISLNQILKQLSMDFITDPGNEKIVQGINTLTDADEFQISFLDNKKYSQDLTQTRAMAVFVHPDFSHLVPQHTLALICDEPYVAVARASQFFAPEIVEREGRPPQIGSNCTIQENTFIGKNTVIGHDCYIMAGSYIGDNVTIGDHTVIYPNVTIYRDCRIGDQVMIHSGAVIGSDGFGFAIAQSGDYIKIYQNGNVVIGNHVEIGANTTIDRAAFASTIIEDNVRIDNLVQIAHNCILKEGCILAAQVGLSGSTTLGERVIMAGKSATTGHLEIAPFTTLAGRAVATKSIKKSGHYAGYPLMEHRNWLKLKGKLQKLLKSS